MSCAQLCLAMPSCFSFNYENIENGFCELNGQGSHASMLVDRYALTAQRGYLFGQFVNISVSISHY